MNVNLIRCYKCGQNYERARGVCSFCFNASRNEPEPKHVARTPAPVPAPVRAEPIALSVDAIVEALTRSGLLGGHGPNSLPPCSYSAPVPHTKIPALATCSIQVRVNAQFAPTFLMLRPSGPVRVERIRVGTRDVFSGGTFDKPTLLQFSNAPATSPAIGVQLCLHNPHGGLVELDGVVGGDTDKSDQGW